eukprot:scaffold19271_cov28-Tisochrysis_lutea.AAC.4
MLSSSSVTGCEVKRSDPTEASSHHSSGVWPVAPLPAEVSTSRGPSTKRPCASTCRVICVRRPRAPASLATAATLRSAPPPPALRPSSAKAVPRWMGTMAASARFAAATCSVGGRSQKVSAPSHSASAARTMIGAMEME